MEESKAAWLKSYARRLNCVNERISILGEYNSDVAQVLGIELVKCNPELRIDCKTDEEIT